MFVLTLALTANTLAKRQRQHNLNMYAPQSWEDTLRLLVELSATAAFALSGLMEAARKKLDAVGVCVVAFLAAFGGGTLRDLLLDQRPFFWVRHTEMLWGVLALCVLAMLFMRQRHFEVTEKTIILPDALGLGLFTATGVHQALQSQMPPVVAVMMGLVAGVFGGVLRDMVCNEIPKAFKDHRPYVVCSFAGGSSSPPWWKPSVMWQRRTVLACPKLLCRDTCRSLNSAWACGSYTARRAGSH